jgi:Fic-DOC domain mobile mystery protein B
MGLILPIEEGQTPLDEEEKEGLLIPSITTREELDEVEQRNIEEAVRWTILRRKKFSAAEILTEQFIKDLHQKMLGGVWKWAGTFRNSNKNIGVDKYQIGQECKILLDDCRYWIAHQTYGLDEIAIRFKHRMVSIHCFANGNGRHSRLIADIMVEKIFGRKVFSWGGQHVEPDLIKTGNSRAAYLKALREADKGAFELLLLFARS